MASRKFSLLLSSCGRHQACRLLVPVGVAESLLTQQDRSQAQASTHQSAHDRPRISNASIALGQLQEDAGTRIHGGGEVAHPRVLPLPLSTLASHIMMSHLEAWSAAALVVSPSEIVQAVATILALTIATRLAYRLWLHPLAGVPGPLLARISDLWKVRETGKGTYVKALREAHARWGDVVRIGPNEVSVVAPEDIKTLYGHGTKWLKGPFYDPWSIGERGHFSHRDPELHGKGRRAVAAAYSTSHLVSLEQFADINTHKLFDYFDRAATSDTAADVTKLIEWFAYDTVSEMSFGKPFGFLDAGEDRVGIIPILASGTAFIVANACLSNWSWVIMTTPAQWLLGKLLGDKGPAVFLKFSGDLAQERLDLKVKDPIAYEEKDDMLSHFFNASDAITRKPLTFGRVVNEASTLVVAGADTTKTTIIAFLLYVYDPVNVETLRKLRSEIDDAVTSGKLDFPVPHAQGAKLEYLQAAIKEATRVWPAVGMTLQRVAPSGGGIVGGRFYPAGTLVGMSAWEIHRDSRAYGPDATVWRPERWLGEDKVELERYNLAFGQGSRVCLGKNISMMEMLKLLPNIIHHYDLSFVDSKNPLRVDESWFTVQHDFLCKIRRRDL